MTTFILTEKEEEQAKKFIDKHLKTCKIKKKKEVEQLSPLFEYSFTPMGIGNIVYIKCCKCGCKRNITDIDTW